jgi:hypothetical protein
MQPYLMVLTGGAWEAFLATFRDVMSIDLDASVITRRRSLCGYEQRELAASKQFPEVSIEADEVFAHVRHRCS